MNIAIVIGVGEYTDPQNDLPGCKKDAEIIHSILTKTGKYNEILYINEKLSSAKVKEKFTDFISDRAKTIDELVFYYTGHGEFQNEEFYYILSDFSEGKRKQTSLQNEEVDSLIKTLKPTLVVKIIDACQSGKTYIKEADTVSKYFKSTEGRFNHCYFLNSSLADQNSFQSNIVSDFTLSFIKSIKEHNSAEIRYKDIIDYISDEFENNLTQTPFFVIQADYTEKFCIINNALKEYLEALDLGGHIEEDTKRGELSLLEKIKKQASEYSTKEQAIHLINEIKIEVESFNCSEELKDIYDLKITFAENYESIIEEDTIGRWLDDNPHEYFAKSSHQHLRKDRHRIQYQGLLMLNRFNEDVEYEWVRNGFELDVDVPYKTIIFNLDSKYPNIESYTCRIIYLLSKRKIRFFYFITNFETKNWDERKLNTKIEWFSSEHPTNDKSNIILGLKDIYNKLESKAKKELDEKFNKKDYSKE